MPAGFDPEHFMLDFRGRTLDCRPAKEIGAHVMGILNVTPDSFSDGGRYTTLPAALARVEEMLSEGARLVDIGGESSRPTGKTYGRGASGVPVREEIDRVVPVVRAVAERFPTTLISVDTWKPDVARAALEAGAHLINDVTGLRYTTETAAAAADFDVPLVLMHSLGKPGDMPQAHTYEDVLREVTESLSLSVQKAVEAGVRHVIVDPGFGFGKTPRENLRLLNDVERILELGRPVMIGVSRKSTIGAVLGTPERPAPVDDRLYGSLGATAVGVLRGASIVRTHDVRPTMEMLSLIGAALNS
ncbi:MAG: dihydropteroate synthase [Rhodothermales bacterium]